MTAGVLARPGCPQATAVVAVDKEAALRYSLMSHRGVEQPGSSLGS